MLFSFRPPMGGTAVQRNFAGQQPGQRAPMPDRAEDQRRGQVTPGGRTILKHSALGGVDVQVGVLEGSGGCLSPRHGLGHR